MGSDPMFLSTSPSNWRGARGQVIVLRTLRRARVLELDHPVWERPLVLGKRDECHYASHSAYLRKLRIGVKASESLSDSFINSRVNVQFAEGERAIKEGHAITDESPSEETIAYWQQADASMHTKHAIRMRLELRRHPMVRESLHNFWSALMSAGFDAGQTPSELNFSAYVVMMKAIYGELIGSMELGPEDLEKSIADDWTRDCRGDDCLTRELLLDSMFELVDVWEHGSRPIDYANWLSRLSGVVCKAFEDLKTGQIEVRQAQGGSNRGCAGTSPTSRHAHVSSGSSVFGGQSQAGQSSAGMSPMGSRAGKRGASTNAANARSSGCRASNTAGKLDAKTRDATRGDSISSIEGDQRIKKAKGRAATVLESGIRAMHARERRRERKDAAGTIGRVARGRTTRSRVMDVYIGGVDANTRQKTRLDLYISQPSTPGMKGVKQRWALRKRAAPIAENQRQLAGRHIPAARPRPQEFQLMTAYCAPVQAGHFVSHRPSSAVARLYSPPSTSNTQQTPNTQEDEHMNSKRPTSYRSISNLLSILSPDPAPKSPLKAPPKILVPQQVKPQLPARWKAQSTTSLIYTNTPTPWPQARTVSRDKRLLARTFNAEKQMASTHGGREAQVQFLTISPRSQTLFQRSRALQTVSSMPHLHTVQSPSQTLPSSTSHIQSGLRESEMRSLTRDLLQYEENLSSANREVALRPSSHASQRTGAWKSVPMPPPNSPPSPMSQRRAVMGSTAPVFALKHPYGHPVLSPGGSAT